MSGERQPTSIRLPLDIGDRLDAVADALAKSTGLPVPRASIMRLALERGLEVLEKEHGLRPPRKGRS